MPAIGSRTFSFNIPVNWLYGIIGLAMALILAFIFVPDPEKWRPVLIFGAAVIAGAAGLTTAVNNVDQRAAQSQKADEAAREARVAAALAVFYRWNDPTFFHCKKAGREIMLKFKSLTRVDDKIAYLREDMGRYANLVDMLNTFEALEIAIDAKVVDNDIAKRFFRSIVMEYWHLTEEIIKKNRAERNNPRLWKEFENLYRRWRD
jgi:hypothetical protein